MLEAVRGAPGEARGSFAKAPDAINNGFGAIIAQATGTDESARLEAFSFRIASRAARAGAS